MICVQDTIHFTCIILGTNKNQGCCLEMHTEAPRRIPRRIPLTPAKSSLQLSQSNNYRTFRKVYIIILTYIGDPVAGRQKLDVRDGETFIFSAHPTADNINFLLQFSFDLQKFSMTGFTFFCLLL